MKVSPFALSVVRLNLAVPVLLLGWDASTGTLGANPVNFALRTTGILALIFLVGSLAVTPASRLGGWSWLGPFRRMLGLNAFSHTVLHFLIFFVGDRAGSVRDTVSEVVLRPYLAVGMFALVLMVPLAATSTDRAIKRLGPKRWKALHRLAYVAATAGVVHFAMLVKSDATRPVAFAVVLGVLFAYRLVAHYLQLRADSRKLRAGPALAPPRPKFWTGRLRVARVFDETPDVRTFRLVGDGPRLPFDFLPGQYLNLALEIDGKPVRRSYTIASSPSRVGSCEISVKREPNGLASRHLHDGVREGDWLAVSAPAGRFTFAGTEAGGIVMIAGGVGVTPLMSKIRYLTDACWPGDIFLVYSARAERDIIFRDELESLRRRFPNLRVTVTLTRADGADWPGERGRIAADLLTRLVPGIATKRAHLCGPTEMTGPIRHMLRGLGVPDESILEESFTSPARIEAVATGVVATEVRVTPPVTAGGGTVTFAKSGRSAESAGRTVLEVAEELDIAIDYDCRSGICGRCKTRLLSGDVAMDADDALDPVDKANGVILSCQARCAGPVVVEA